MDMPTTLRSLAVAAVIFSYGDVCARVKDSYLAKHCVSAIDLSAIIVVLKAAVGLSPGLWRNALSERVQQMVKRAEFAKQGISMIE
ncbi:hypothetical protein EPA93_05510 [Ktedonosporobacter rubrisoli]|uniref:Uncharacterized protein n=1 Tax=Ktedonosporobacter rubrisoli TaxID=2509675 RepID=A0A4P6JK20_KTERU|nr:hypothetical protein [Ktedonosporobacter rubrisoli]QBD75488.1 hypothetical protein EPA93_05510 [Ktedonosporobacter rubrisoli]